MGSTESMYVKRVAQSQALKIAIVMLAFLMIMKFCL